MHCTHSCGSLVKQFPISNETDLTIYPRKHCRKQDAAAGLRRTESRARSRILLSTMLSRVDPGSLEMGNCFTSEPQECVQCIVKVRDQETQTQRRPDRRTLGVPRNEANEKRAEHYRQRKGLAI